MQVIEQHPYVDQVLASIPGETGMGESLAEDPTLEFLDDEIMKVGSLAHNDIDWHKVEIEALKLLADRSKDIKVLGFVMLSLQRGGDGERFALSLYLLHRVLDEWWQGAWPYPGPKGRRARKMLFTQMLQRALKAVDCLSFDASVGDGRQFCLDLIDKLETQAKGRDLPVDALLDLKRAVEKLPGPDQAPAARTTPISTPVTENNNRASSPDSGSGNANTTSASLGNLTLDPSNERATRQSLLKVAEHLTGMEPDNALGYRMRRYAIWHSISSPPPTRDRKCTDLAAVSADRIAEYKEALAKTPDLELWQRIEQSLSVSPFWLDGHWLSARVATALGNPDCAEAIREAVKGFVERLPQLVELTFNDGTPFLSDDAADWVHATPAAGKGTTGGANPWDQAFDSARDLARQNKLAAAMELLEQGLADARQPRERFYWRLASARLLRETGLKALAAEQIQDLKNQAQGRVLDDWEPTLIKQLERLA